MNIKLLDASDIAKKLKQLINRHDEIYLAVAWGSNGPTAKRLLKNKNKFRSVTFGLTFFHTDPDFIKELVGTKNAFVADDVTSTFHPKIYYFQSNDTAEAIIGSSNFTAGGLNRNWEANVHIKGPKSASVFNQVRKCLENYAELQKPITKEIEESYRQQHDAAKSLKKIQNPILPGGGLLAGQLNSKLVRMNWSKYEKKVMTRSSDNYAARIGVLRQIQAMFAKARSFGALSSAERKAIAGTLGQEEAGEANLNQPWKWFGNMGPARAFANRVAENDHFLFEAVDSIPRFGEVTRTQYEVFLSKFQKAFKKFNNKGGGVATATRLLAMKRPDTFVCICNPNKIGLSRAAAFPLRGPSLENYWEWVIEPLQTSVWYTSPRPTDEFGDQADLWDFRAAMLDAIYYKPKKSS